VTWGENDGEVRDQRKRGGPGRSGRITARRRKRPGMIWASVRPARAGRLRAARRAGAAAAADG